MNTAQLEKLSGMIDILIDKNTTSDVIKAGYQYAVLPAGKLFRPQLCLSVNADLNGQSIDELTINSDALILAAAIEIHHAYTLVHDDLPAMDNDDFRRGKPSTHKAFGEWQALLIGDGLLNLSYRLVSQLKTKNLKSILNFMTWALGPKGLIHGQVLDLSEVMTSNFKNLIRTHQMKTARLIQVALCTSCLLNDNYKREDFYNLFRLGHSLGISFQLIDDLTELTEAVTNAHEREVNPWFNFLEESQSELIKRLTVIYRYTSNHPNSEVTSVIENYLKKMSDKIITHQEIIKSNIKIDLDPVVSLL